MQIIDERVHGVLDYLVALTLIVAPFLFGLGEASPVELWLSVVAGAGLLAYSLLTSYSLGARSLIPFRTHLLLDFAAGSTFVVAAFLLGFGGFVRGYYLVVGLAVMLVVVLTKPVSLVRNTMTA